MTGFAIVAGLTRQVYLGSLALGLGLAGAVIALDPAQAFADRLHVTVFALAVAALLFYTHRSNIRQSMNRRREVSVGSGGRRCRPLIRARPGHGRGPGVVALDSSCPNVAFHHALYKLPLRP